MQKSRKNYNAAFKAKLALEAVKGEKTISQLSSDHGIHGNQIRQWKKKLLDNLPNIFIEKKNIENGEELISELYRQIANWKQNWICSGKNVKNDFNNRKLFFTFLKN